MEVVAIPEGEGGDFGTQGACGGRETERERDRERERQREREEEINSRTMAATGLRYFPNMWVFRGKKD